MKSKTKQKPPVEPEKVLSRETAEKVLLADVANILKKAKSGKPLTKHEREIIKSARDSQPVAAPAPDGGRSRKSRDLPIYESKKQAATALGVADTVPLDELQKLGCPGFTHGRVDLLAVVKWVLTRVADSEEGPKFRAMWEEYRAKREKIKHDKEAKEVADKPLTILGLGKIQSLFFALLDRWRNECPPSFKGRDEREIFNALGVRIDDAKLELKTKFEQLEKGETE